MADKIVCSCWIFGYIYGYNEEMITHLSIVGIKELIANFTKKKKNKSPNQECTLTLPLIYVSLYEQEWSNIN